MYREPRMVLDRDPSLLNRIPLSFTGFKVRVNVLYNFNTFAMVSEWRKSYGLRVDLDLSRLNDHGISKIMANSVLGRWLEISVSCCEQNISAWFQTQLECQLIGLFWFSLLTFGQFIGTWQIELEFLIWIQVDGLIRICQLKVLINAQVKWKDVIGSQLGTTSQRGKSRWLSLDLH